MTHVPADQTPGPDHRADRTPNAWVANPDLRRYLYLLVAMVMAGLVVFNIVTEDQIAEWVRVTGWLLGLGGSALAAVNVPKR